MIDGDLETSLSNSSSKPEILQKKIVDRRRFLIDSSKFIALISTIALPFGSWLKFLDMVQGIKVNSRKALKKIDDINFGNFKAKLISGFHGAGKPNKEGMNGSMVIDEKDLDPFVGGFFLDWGVNYLDKSFPGEIKKTIEGATETDAYGTYQLAIKRNVPIIFGDVAPATYEDALIILADSSKVDTSNYIRVLTR